jgi:adenosine deaminase
MDPFSNVEMTPMIAALPKADLHRHQEEVARLERVVAQRQRRAAHDWRPSARQVYLETPPGLERLTGVYAPDASLDLGDAPADAPEYLIAKMADALEDAAAVGAWLVEVRFGVGGLALLRPDFMALFREAERRVQASYPQLRAEAIGLLFVISDPAQQHVVEQQLETCLRAARNGLAGIDFIARPYDKVADPSTWAVVYNLAARAADAGLGITVHAGEFSTANIAAALRVPGLRRLGHAVHAADDPRLLDALIRSDATVECSLTCNVVLGATTSYEAHPIRQFVVHGVPVALSTDLPIHIGTTIGREYAIAAALGFTPGQLLEFTRNAFRASFTTAERKRSLMAELQQWQAGHGYGDVSADAMGDRSTPALLKESG